MKRIFISLISLLSLFLAVGCEMTETSTGDKTQSTIDNDLKSTPSNQQEKGSTSLSQKKWTVLVYMDGDNNLSPYSSMDIREMSNSGSDENFNIIVLWDNDPSQDNNSNNIHGYYRVDSNGPTMLKDTGEINMGNPKTAEDFIDYAAANFSAEHYLWIYWNHGGAVDRVSRGICWDDTNGGDHLSEIEQKQVMKHFKEKIGKKIDVVGFDACLMATGEIDYQYKDFASYLVASEETVPGEGWDYNFLKEIKRKPSITPLTLSKKIIAYYKSFYSTKTEGKEATLSVISLAQSKKFGALLDEFSESAKTSGVPKTTFKKLSKGLGMFGVYPGDSKDCYYTKDLNEYLNKIIKYPTMPQSVKDSASLLSDFLAGKKFVVSEWHGSSWKNKAYGVSMTFKYATSTYKKLDLCVDTTWDEFLNWAGFPDNDYVY